MSYYVELSPHAAQQIQNIPAELRGAVVDHLYRLAEAPTRLSWPSATPPHPPGYQVYEFQAESGGERHVFAVLFKYCADEIRLWVYGIGDVNYGEAEPFDLPE